MNDFFQRYNKFTTGDNQGPKLNLEQREKEVRKFAKQ